MRCLALLLMSALLCALWQGINVSSASYDTFGRLEWRGGRVDWSGGNSRGTGQLAFYRNHLGDRFALHVRYGRHAEHEQRITARLAPSLSVVRQNSQAFKVIDAQGEEIGTGQCVFVEEFDWGQDHRYQDGGDNCTLSFSDTVHGKVEIKLGFAREEGLQFVEGRVTQGTHDFAWWPNPDFNNSLAAINTTSYAGQNNRVQFTYTYNERYGVNASDSSFALLLKTADKQYHITALANNELPGAIWGREDNFRLLHPITEAGQIGQGNCQRTTEQGAITCDLEFHHLGQQVTLTKTYRYGELTSIAGTVVTDNETIRWEAVDMREITTPSPLCNTL